MPLTLSTWKFPVFCKYRLIIFAIWYFSKSTDLSEGLKVTDATDGRPFQPRTSSNFDWFVKRWNHDTWKTPSRLRSKSSPTIKRPPIHFSAFTKKTIIPCFIHWVVDGTRTKRLRKWFKRRRRQNTWQKFTNSLLLNFVMTKDFRWLFEFHCCATSKTFAFVNEVFRSITPRETIKGLRTSAREWTAIIV